MAFKLDQSPSYRWPVEVNVTAEDGSHTEAKFYAQFRRVSQPELEKLVDKVTAKDEKERMRDRDFCELNVVGWDGVQGPDGNELPFSPEALAKLLDILNVQGALVRAYFDSVKLGQEKNSERRPEPGPTPPPVLN